MIDGIANNLSLYKVTFHETTHVLAESEEEARRIYREYREQGILHEVVDVVDETKKYNQV